MFKYYKWKRMSINADYNKHYELSIIVKYKKSLFFNKLLVFPI